MGKQQPNPSKPRHHPHHRSNPNNKLSLNKFHQLDTKTHITQSQQLHKKKRDLQRLIKFKQEKNQDVDKNKVEELEKIREKLEGTRKIYEKGMRKEFFIKNRYKQIMDIEMRKINKKIRGLQQATLDEDGKKQLAEWQKKQRYIKFFPKNLKYVSLFPSTKPLQPGAIEFQQKIMKDIEQTYAKKIMQRNQYVSQNIKTEKPSKKERKDNFFIEDQEEEQEQEQQQQM